MRHGACVLHARRTSPPVTAVKITLLSDDRIRYEPAPGPLTVDAPRADAEFSPYHMVASGLAACTYALLSSWASHAQLSADDLVIEVTWTFADRPHRIAALDLTFTWPSLPASRLEAAKRAAALCPVHVSFEHPPTLAIAGSGAPDEAPGTPPTPSPSAATPEPASRDSASAPRAPQPV